MNILAECDRRGIRIEADGDMLKVDAPKGAVSPALIEALKTHKPEILAALQAEDLREHLEERAGILEYDGGLPRPEAEIEAARMTTTAARNRGYSWVALRSALAGYPALCSQIPDKSGSIDSLPLGLPKLAVLRDRRVVRQGAFTGEHVVKGAP